MTTMNISLPAPLKEWVTAQQASGRYSNASDYVRDLIRRDQEKIAETAHLQQLVDEGLASGVSELTVEDILAQAVKTYEQQKPL
ncbi:MAG: hypothetical protein B7Y80_16940 [Hyphomicrobium sp. 32-62-53]|nr:MAG: hypothetical protein B7Z29_08050 [Hyphomicrobium sp. 12-62-95]OYX98061.1 MAG: hypothetical protein B7Y80_16940 [Hyphomicrobium sp. 32-62-53]